ncbi:ubiquinol oxidase subunit II [Sodalis-like secondary symbiont of Drepanosiphum platanoidis]|uniref:ubiquinol oxidase subunit II n=1 Tax=Sodalis-like secondary symbiont of Drepanosiphum platanoidis TaxID=2994493 RepID=UPI0034644F5E
MRFKKYKNFLKKIFILSITIFLFGCNNLIIMNPKGIIAIKEKTLMITVMLLMLTIVVPVILMTLIFVFKYRESKNSSLYDPNWSDSKKIELIIWIIPFFMILFLANLTWKSTHDLDPNKPIEPYKKYIRIQVISLDWRWLFIYPKQKIATINELVFPKNTPIKFELTSNSVMNSFFIPGLGGQIYTMAGMNSVLNLMSNTKGIYKGMSSNFSGKGFSNMKFKVIVTKNTDIFNKWIKKVKLSSNYIKNIFDYEQISLPNENTSIKYFSLVKDNLFQIVIKKFH